ncbi:MAG: patatin-like phospholipase family protein [Chloroflexi bacterium]|nr:patatin-like phospholipase family protein [Chloroflexota bacterium]
MALLERLQAKGPKRILALDGGGIRGAITIEFLARIEAELRERHENPQLKLSEYFDLIGGTSTGAIIAAGLATGLDTRELRDLYSDLGGIIFETKRWRSEIPLIGKLSAAKISSAPLEEQLVRVLGNRTLGDPNISTGLCLIARRADTSSTWPLINHPLGRYYPKNRDIPLARAVRASTAAPLYFMPEELEVGDGEIGAFVDGGMSMANNPALQLFFVATLQGFPFRWPTGADNLLVVSVGTGSWSRRESIATVMNPRIDQVAARTVSGLMDDASWQNQLVLQALSRTPTPWQIDREVGTLANERLVKEPLLHYIRYNAELEPEALKELGLDHLAARADDLRAMDKAEQRDELAEVGRAAAAKSVSAAHFPRSFDIRPQSNTRPPFRPLNERTRAVEEVRSVSGPVLRNLLITQFYYETANEIAARIGGQNVTWFAFGAWASNVAGTFIRGSGVPGFVRAIAGGGTPVPGVLESGAADFLAGFRETMAEGNLIVFDELAPIAARFVVALDEGPDAVRAVVEAIPPDAEGRTLLRGAFQAYGNAAASPDARTRAQYVLAGNLQAVFHEQRRLQPLLERTLTLPFVDSLKGVAGPVAGSLKREWRRFATKFILQYDLPGVSLKAGQDVRSAFPGDAFPRDVVDLDIEPANAIWAELCGQASDTRGSSASDWSSLTDRMAFIATVFRARQQDTGLLSPPFSRLEVDELRALRFPPGYVETEARR